MLLPFRGGDWWDDFIENGKVEDALEDAIAYEKKHPQASFDRDNV